MNQQPLISIVTAVFNSEKYLAEAIRSVLNQEYMNWEWIIVDDGSTDNSFEMIEKASQLDKRIKAIRNEKNSGPAITRNRGIELAQGEFLAFLDSDDLWMKNHLMSNLNYQKNKDALFVFSSYLKKNEDLSCDLGHFQVPKKVNYKDILKGNPISTNCVLINIGVLGKYYMEDLKRRQDFTMWLKYLKPGISAYGNPEFTAIYRMRKESISSNKFKSALYQWQVYRKIEKLSLVKSIYYFSHYVIYGLYKYKRLYYN